MARKRLTKRKSEAIRRLLDRWYESYYLIGLEGPIDIFGIPLSRINTRVITDLWIANIKENHERNDSFDEDIRMDVEYAEELYNYTVDD
jgi:hypothetical protein